MVTMKDVFLREILDKASEAILVTDINDEIRYKNKAAEELFSLESNYLPKLLDYKATQKTELLKMGGKALQVRIQQGQLDETPVNIWYIIDATEKEKKNHQLKLLLAIVDTISEGVIASNSEGKIVLYNSRLESLEGRCRDQLLGKHITEAYDVDLGTSEHMYALKTGEPIVDVNLNYIASNKEMHIVSSTYPLKAEGKIIAVYSISRDITGIRQLLLRTMDIQGNRARHKEKETPDNGTTFTLDDIVGQSHSVKQVIRKAQKAAISPSPVLVYGETGTGKELVIQGIHNAGASRNEPFVAVNCAAIPESLLESTLFGTVRGAFTGGEDRIGLFEQAGRGTLYLDEINSMPIGLQAKILRVFQEKKVRRVGAQAEKPIQCRMICSTNLEPWQCVEEGVLRKDLYYRLAVIQIYIPPLRKRPEDIEVLVDYFIKMYNRIYGKHHLQVSNHLMNLFKEHSWPGNVRELEHTIENSLAMVEADVDELTAYNLPYPLFPRSNKNLRNDRSDGLNTLGEILADVEKKTIINSLKLHNWNITKAARGLGIGRQNLQYRMAKVGVKRPTRWFPEINSENMEDHEE